MPFLHPFSGILLWQEVLSLIPLVVVRKKSSPVSQVNGFYSSYKSERKIELHFRIKEAQHPYLPLSGSVKY